MNPLFSHLIDPAWKEILKEEFQQPYMQNLTDFIQKEYEAGQSPIYPPQDLIFNALNLTSLNKVQVVIVGQDPYHGFGQAHGLCFSVPKGIKPPPSLQNIFKELSTDLQIPKPSQGCLISWARQGILLLNATLTVCEKKPLSHHKKGWEKFTDTILQLLFNRSTPLIFVLWGKSAQEKCRFLINSTSSPHIILKAAHPSPLSAYNGFFGCRHFSKINHFLMEVGKAPIDFKI